MMKRKLMKEYKRRIQRGTACLLVSVMLAGNCSAGMTQPVKAEESPYAGIPTDKWVEYEEKGNNDYVIYDTNYVTKDDQGILYGCSDDKDDDCWVIGFAEGSGQGSITIPGAIKREGKNYLVTSVAFGAFKGCTTLEKVVFEEDKDTKEGIREIRPEAFAQCGNLASVTLPANTCIIDGYDDVDDVFDGCSSLTLHGYAGSVAEKYAKEHGHAFEKVSSDYMVIEDKQGILYGCNTADDTSRVLGGTLVAPDGYWDWINGWSNDGDEHEIWSITIPKTIVGEGKSYSVVAVAKRAFYGESFEKVVFEESKDGKLAIEDEAFASCEYLTNVTLPANVNDISDTAFDNGSDKLTIYGYAGSVAEKYAKKHGYAFSNLIKNGMVFTDAKGKCKVKVLSASKRTISYTKTTDKGTTVKVPDTVVIKGGTYKVTKIADKALQNNSRVKKVIIGTNVVSIGKQAFQNCSRLAKIEIKGTKLSSVGTHAVLGTKYGLAVKVPKSKVAAYKKKLRHKGNPRVFVNQTGKTEKLKYLKLNFDLKKNKPVTYKERYVGIGVHRGSVTLESMKITKAAKKGYKKAVIKLKWDAKLTSSQVHKIVQSPNRNKDGYTGGMKFWMIIDGKTGEDLSDDGVTTKENYKYKKYKDKDGCWIKCWSAVTLTVTYPSSYQDICLGAGGISNSINWPASWYDFSENKIPYQQTSMYKKERKNVHFIKIQ